MKRFSVYSKWQERVRLLFSLPLTNRALKYFPPEFTLRDPIVSMVHRIRKRGQTCAVMLFHMEGYNQMIHTCSAETLTKTAADVRDAFKSVLPNYYQEVQIIGARQMSGEDFCIFIRYQEDDTYLKTHYKALMIRDELERRMRPAQDAIGPHESLRFDMGFFVMDKGPEEPRAAISFAYHYAKAIATKRLPNNFYYTRKELSDIIQSENITVLAQPIMHLRSGEIFGWEILTRGPQHSPFHFPSELFEFAHQSDLLYHMEMVVVRKALQEISKREIKEQVFINITAISLRNPMFLEDMLDYMDLFPSIQPQQIILEITERHAIKDYLEMSAIMARYRQHGFRFAVDDAGSGYSSLQSISELIPDMIKIDRSLIQNIDQASAKQSLLKALLYFAENINCRVIAEGIERKEEADILFQHQVEMGQGFYFGEPGPLILDHERTRELIKKKIQYHLDSARAPA